MSELGSYVLAETVSDVDAAQAADLSADATDSLPVGLQTEAGAESNAEHGTAQDEPDQDATDKVETDIVELRQLVTTTCLVILSLIAIGFAMFFAKSIILPILFAFLLNFFFSPLILRMRRFGIPTFAGAILLLFTSLVAIVMLLVVAYQPAIKWVQDAPATISKVEEKLRTVRKPIAELKKTSEKLDAIVAGEAAVAESQAIETVDDDSPANKTKPWFGVELPFSGEKAEEAAKQLEKAKEELKEEVNAERPVAVAVKQPSLTGFILDTTGNAIVGISLSVVILFFLLAAGDRGLEKMVELMPTWREKRNVVELTRNIQHSISRYMLTTTTINVGLGIVIGLGMWIVGLPNPVLWGVMAAFLNFLPFVGAIVGALIVFLVAAVSFDSMTYSLIAPAVYLGVNLIEANLITPTLLGHSISLHPVWLMIFFSFVGWIWGVSGAIIAVPTLAVIKISCDHIPPLAPVGRFLGR